MMKHILLLTLLISSCTHVTQSPKVVALALREI
jgi:hypothetical protein